MSLTSFVVLLVVSIVSFSGFPSETKVLFSSNEKHSSQPETPNDVDYDDVECIIEVNNGQEVISSTLTRNGHFGAIRVKVHSFGETFILDLKLNRYLLGAGYVEKVFTNGVAVHEETNHIENHCFYLGEVRGRLHSSAAISTCKGISGYFSIGDVAYHIEPEGDQIKGPHRVYRSRDESKTIYRCGHEPQSLGSLMNPLKFTQRVKRDIPWPQDLDNTTKVVELYVANSFQQFQAQGSSSTNVFQRAKSIVNRAASAYRTLGIYLVLVGMEVWSDRERIAVNFNSPNETLFSFADYRLKSISPNHINDNAVLILHNSFFGNIVGFAAYGEMCSILNSVSFVADVNSGQNSPDLTGTILAHEMGHNFGFSHDNATCACPGGGACIMSAEADTGTAPSLSWSQCSKTQLVTSFQYGLDYCLNDVPRTLFDSIALCGNGIVDIGEQCDCGGANIQECNPACCDSTTCQLINAAQCAYGRCCNVGTCQILSCGTTCRSKSGYCDLAEYCDGQSPLCPVNTYLPDGSSCTTDYGDAAFCYKGRCASRSSQCQFVGGATVSADTCYSFYNVHGSVNGSCGINWFQGPSYTPCSSGDVLCGNLQCQTNTIAPRYKPTYIVSPKSVGSDVCISAIFAFGPELENPGFVPNGSPCGTGKMCLNRACVSLSSLSSVTCSPSCQSNQTCNNLAQCQNTTFSRDGFCPTVSTTTGSTTTSTTFSGTRTSVTTLSPGSVGATSQSGVLSTPMSAGATTGFQISTIGLGSAATTAASDAWAQAAKAAIVAITLGSAMLAVTLFSLISIIAAKCFGFV